MMQLHSVQTNKQMVQPTMTRGYIAVWVIEHNFLNAKQCTIHLTHVYLFAINFNSMLTNHHFTIDCEEIDYHNIALVGR